MSDTIELAEAVKMLPDGEQVHTFRNGCAGVLIGADWGRASLIDAMTAAMSILLCGPEASSFNHGLCIIDGHGRLFIETRPDCQKEDGCVVGPPQTEPAP